MISHFNLHGDLQDDDEGVGDDVVELVRPPSRQDLLFSQTGLRGPVRTLQLHVTGNNPYLPQNRVYEGPCYDVQPGEPAQPVRFLRAAQRKLNAKHALMGKAFCVFTELPAIAGTMTG